MGRELLVLDPNGSTSILEPLSALQIFLAAPHRWKPSLVDKNFEGIRVLSSSRFIPILNRWSFETGLDFHVANANDDWISKIVAVLLFDERTLHTTHALFTALGIEVVCFDLELGTFVECPSRSPAVSVASVVQPLKAGLSSKWVS